VEFFLLEYRSGSPGHFNEEVDGVRLVSLHQAPAIVSYPGERDVLTRAQDHLLGKAGSTTRAAKESAGALRAVASP
jgi:hypothetical protein